MDNIENESQRDGQQAQESLIFKSEDERFKALDELPDTPPPDTEDIEEWEKEQSSLQKRIEDAKIAGQEGGPEPTGNETGTETDPSKTGKSSDATSESKPGHNPEDWTMEYKGEKITLDQKDIPTDRRFTFKNVKDALHGFVNTQHYLDKLKNDHSSAISLTQSELQRAEESNVNLQAEIDKLKLGGTSQSLPDGIPTEQDIETSKQALESLDGEINELDEDDPSGFSLMRDLRKKEKVYNGLLQKRTNYLDEQQSKIKEESDRKSTELANKTKADEAQTKEFGERRSSINDFLQQSSDFQTTNSYDQVEKNSIDFGRQLASVYYNKSADQVGWKEFEIATKEYLSQTPAFMKKLGETGMGPNSPLSEPKDFRTYLVASEVELLQRGKKINPETGAWEDVMVNGQKVTHPDMQSAYDYWKRINGVQAQERISDMDKGAQEILRAINQSGAIEISSSDAGAQKEGVKANMNYEDAVKSYSILEKQGREEGFSQLEDWITQLERANPGDSRVKMWDECVSVMETATSKR